MNERMKLKELRIQYINAFVVTYPDARICKALVESNVHTLLLLIGINDSTTWATFNELNSLKMAKTSDFLSSFERLKHYQLTELKWLSYRWIRKKIDGIGADEIRSIRQNWFLGMTIISVSEEQRLWLWSISSLSEIWQKSSVHTWTK